MDCFFGDLVGVGGASNVSFFLHDCLVGDGVSDDNLVRLLVGVLVGVNNWILEISLIVLFLVGVLELIA